MSITKLIPVNIFTVEGKHIVSLLCGSVGKEFSLDKPNSPQQELKQSALTGSKSLKLKWPGEQQKRNCR